MVASPDAPVRALVLSPTPTWPRDYGNRKRVHAVCSALKARGVSVSFLFFPWECEWIDGTVYGAHHDRALREMTGQWDALYVSPVTLPGHTPPADGPDHALDEWWDPALDAYLRWLFRVRRFDMLLVNYPYLSRALVHAPPGVLRVLDMHDRFSGRREYLERQGIAPEFFHLSQAEEARALDRADIVWAIKEEEAAFFRTLSETPVLTMPHRDARDPGEASSTSHDKACPDDGLFRMGFLGARNNINRINCERFLERFLPLLAASGLPARMLLAGTVCLDIDASWRSHPLVECLGPLADVRTFYDRVDLVVAPISFSTGLKIKIVEAMEYGAPLVAHAHAAEGVPVRHPLHRLADVDAVAEACLRVAAQPALAAELRQAGDWSLAALGRQVDRTLTATLEAALAARSAA